MEKWGADLYGDPCRECGFDWTISPQQAVDVVRGLPGRFGALLEGRTGRERDDARTWSAVAYVCHVGDNLRAWAERLAGARLAGAVDVPGYDQDRLAQARSYEGIAPAAALWSLGRTAQDWAEVVTLALAEGVVLRHAARGTQGAEDVARNNAHDGHHHVWDVECIVRHAAGL